MTSTNLSKDEERFMYKKRQVDNFKNNCGLKAVNVETSTNTN